MIIRVGIFISLVCMALSFQTTLALSETNKEKAPIDVSELKRKIALILHCETPPCDVEKVRKLYEKILRVENTLSIQLGYGVILQHTAKNEEELRLGQEMEKKEREKKLLPK